MSIDRTAGISDARDKVFRIKEELAKGYSVEEACRRNNTTVKDYKATIEFLNRNGFNYSIK